MDVLHGETGEYLRQVKAQLADYKGVLDPGGANTSASADPSPNKATGSTAQPNSASPAQVPAVAAAVGDGSTPPQFAVAFKPRTPQAPPAVVDRPTSRPASGSIRQVEPAGAQELAEKVNKPEPEPEPEHAKEPEAQLEPEPEPKLTIETEKVLKAQEPKSEKEQEWIEPEPNPVPVPVPDQETSERSRILSRGKEEDLGLDLCVVGNQPVQPQEPAEGEQPSSTQEEGEGERQYPQILSF